MAPEFNLIPKSPEDFAEKMQSDQGAWVEISTTPTTPQIADRTHALRTDDLPPGVYTFRVWNPRIPAGLRSETPSNEASTTI